MGTPTIPDLLVEYENALGHTNGLWKDLSSDQVLWRPHEESSAIGWHLGHQAAVAHFMVRNLTAAEPSPNPELDAVMDSATVERQRGDLPPVDVIADYRDAVAGRVRSIVERIDSGDVGAPAQLARIATTMMTAIINHEYQHSQWIGEVRSDQFGLDLPTRPESPLLTEVDGYLMLR